MAELTYTRTNWKDFPEKTTPVNATNLNNIENGIEINKANIDKLSAKVVEKAKDFQGNGIIVARDQGTVEESTTTISDLATRQDLDELSTNGITFEKGDFSVGADILDDEFLYAPRGSNLIVESSNDRILALINEGGYLQLPHVTYPTTDNDAATKKYVDNAVSACASTTDYGNSIIASIDSRFRITYQHTVRIGKIIFVHFTFTLIDQIDSNIYPFAQIVHNNFFPNHDHGIVICGYNDSMASSSALRTDSAVIKTDGSIWFRAVSSGTSSNFSYDVSCFYSLTDTAFNALN